MRSMTPLALLSIAAQEPGTPVGHAVARMPLLRHLRSRGALVTFGLAALGELAGDKLPFIPARVSFGPLLGRAIIGATAGAIVSSGWSGSAERGARRGAAAAFLAAWFGYTARTQLSRRTPIPDPVWALAEDALAIGLGILALWPSLAPSVRYLLSQFPRIGLGNGTRQAGAEQAPGWAYTSGSDERACAIGSHGRVEAAYYTREAKHNDPANLHRHQERRIPAKLRRHAPARRRVSCAASAGAPGWQRARAAAPYRARQAAAPRARRTAAGPRRALPGAVPLAAWGMYNDESPAAPRSTASAWSAASSA